MITVVTYCSKNYESALRWVLPSWLRPEIRRIIVVADFVPEFTGADHIDWRADYAPSEDWVEVNCRRAEVAANYLPAGYVAFLDLDCWIRGDITPAFGAPGTISVTRFFSTEPHTGGTITDGVFFASMDDSVREFMREWDRRVKANPRTHTQVGAAVTPQYRFTELCREAWKTGQPAHVNPIFEGVWNAEHSVRSELIAKCRRHNPRVLHFKGRQWADQAFVDEALAACGEPNQKEAWDTP